MTPECKVIALHNKQEKQAKKFEFVQRIRKLSNKWS